MFSSNIVESSIPQTQQEWTQALQEEFNFTAEDCAANQRREYSTAQKAVLEPLVMRANNDPGCFAVLAMGLLGLLVLGMLGLILLNTALDGLIVTFLSIYPNGLIAGLAALGGVATLILSAFNVMHQRAAINSMDKFIMRRAEGPASLHASYAILHQYTSALVTPRRHIRRGKGRERIYRVHIGDKDFNLPKSSAERFLPGAVYRVYYLNFLNNTVLLLSAELIQMP